MSDWRNRIGGMHAFLAGHALYPLVLSSALAVAFYAGRVMLSHSATYLFLLWNLFLAWIPYLLSLWMASFYRRFPRLVLLLLLPGALWLVFFPNAPYLVTDLLHFEERWPVPLWYDIGLFATFAWTGVFLGVHSLRAVQLIVKGAAGRIVGWLMAFTTIGLGGLGIYIGRFLGWNSWDLFLDAPGVMTDTLHQFRHPISHPQPFAVALMFASFLLICYLTLTWPRDLNSA